VRVVALSARDLCLEGKFRGVSFDLRKGEILGFAGLVGSGRSNVAETLFGVTPATSGAILIEGNEIAITNPGVAMDAGMAFLTEDRKESGCFLLLDIMANMQIALLRHGYATAGFVNEGKIEALCQQQKSRLRVRTPDLEEPIINLSGGNQQNVLIARWLLTQPKTAPPASPAVRPSSTESPAPSRRESAPGASIKRSFSTQFVDSGRPPTAARRK
jgi:inositol transport system ATP-binding protein